MQQEEEAKTSSGGKSSSVSNAHHVNKWKEETGDDQYGEYIDMDMDDECVSDVESES